MSQASDDHTLPATPEAGGEGVSELQFPDMPRMQLEELLGQLSAQAQNVLRTQGRLRALLRANAAVASDLSLPVVLRHIVTAAQELVGARYAALGVIGADGTLEEFVHAGMDAAAVEQVGRLPKGLGLLGLLISQPRPLRLTDLSAHPATAGFPPNHPPMTSFLGVPIRLRDQVFGNLYLTESDSGDFSAEDEQLVSALAVTAGVAIDNARLYQQTLMQRQWLAASTEVTQRLFAGYTEQPMELVLGYAVRGAAADFATLVMPVADGRMRVQAAVGSMGEPMTGKLGLDTTLAWRVIQAGKPVRVTDHETEFGDRPDGDGPAPVSTSAVGVPLLAADGGVLGALIVGRTVTRTPFTDEDMTQLAGFAYHAGVALALDSARRAAGSLNQRGPTVLDGEGAALDWETPVESPESSGSSASQPDSAV